MKRFIAFCLTLIMIVSTLAGCADGYFRFPDDTSLTKGEWISLLSRTFGMDEYQISEPVFSDVDENDEIFGAVQACYEWGVLRDVKNRLDKYNGATLRFVVSTSVYSIGDVFALYKGDTDEEKALEYAVANGIIPLGLDYNKWATKEQCNVILSKCQELYLSQKKEEIDRVVINEEVIDLRGSSNIQYIQDHQYLVSDLEPKVGEILIAPGTSDNPDGVAIKIIEVTEQENGAYLVKTSIPELYEVFDEIEYSGTAYPQYEDIVPAEGVTIQRNELLSSDINSGGGTENLLVMLSEKNDGNIMLGANATKDKPLAFTANVNFTKGEISLTPQWGNMSANINQLLTGASGTASPKLGEWFEKKSVFPDKTLFGSEVYGNDEAIEAYKKGVINADELKQALKMYEKEDGTENIPNVTNKFKGGYEIIGTLGITNMYVDVSYKFKTKKVFGIDTGIPSEIESYTIETNYDVLVSLSIKGHLEEELTICSVPVSLGGVGVLKIDFILYAELNGEVAVKAAISNNVKTEYQSGKTKKTATKEASASAEAELEFETGPKIKATLSFCTIPFINADVSAAIRITANMGCEYTTEWTETESSFVIDRKTVVSYGVDGYVPIVKLAIGTDKSTLANKLSIKFSWTIVGAEGSHAPLEANKFSIIKGDDVIVWQEHIEMSKDGKLDTETQQESIGSNMDISTYYIHLIVGESEQIEIEYPVGYSSQDFVWTSSNQDVVTVSRGVVNAKNPGVATIKAQSMDGKHYAVCAIYVGESE